MGAGGSGWAAAMSLGASVGAGAGLDEGSVSRSGALPDAARRADRPISHRGTVPGEGHVVENDASGGFRRAQFEVREAGNDEQVGFETIGGGTDAVAEPQHDEPVRVRRRHLEVLAAADPVRHHDGFRPHRLERCVRETDTLARIGDDSFAIIVEDLTQADHAERVKQTVQEALAEPMHLADRDVVPATRVRLQFYPQAPGEGPGPVLYNS